MRHILVDNARCKRRVEHGGDGNDTLQGGAAELKP